MQTGGKGSTVPIPEVPNYDLLLGIGHGSYGRVWMARSITGCLRAVKFVYRAKFEEERPFEREFEGIRKYESISLTHPNLVPILHVGRNAAAGHFFYVMELADDMESENVIDPGRYVPKTLKAIITKRSRVPPEECVEIGISLAEGLGHLHKKGLIHRDIKPSNIVFVNGIPKLADIGLVTAIGDEASVVGSFGYMAPEGPGKPRADVYGLGKVLYVASMGARAEDFPTIPSSLTDDGSFVRMAGLNRVICKACEPRADARFQSAAELREALVALREGASPSAAHGVTGASSSKKAAARPLNIVIVYKANAQPDETVLRLLESELQTRGHEVFIDGHATIGLEWVREIEPKIRAADAVIILLSSASIQSEMVAYEVEVANETRQHDKKLVLLPIRVSYEEPLTESLGRVLNDLEHTRWNSPEDNQRVVREILSSLRSPQTRSTRPKIKFEPVGGAVPLASKFYIVRPADEEFCSAVAQQDSIVLVKGARQMGKTSLLARGLQVARDAGARVVLTDFQMLNNEHLQSADRLFLTLAESIAAQLELDIAPQRQWSPQSGPNLNFQRFLVREVFKRVSTPLVWGLDEVDRLFSCSFGSEVFGLFRSWHNARPLEPAGPWSRLTLAIAYATEAHLFITDPNQSPFNVGTRITLEDFTFEQVEELNCRYGSPLGSAGEVKQLFDLIGGHPYLVRRALHEIATRQMDIVTFAQQADRDEGVFGDHLRRILVLLAKSPELLEVMRGILRGRGCPNAESFYRLRSAGVLGGESLERAAVRCRVYESYLRRALC